MAHQITKKGRRVANRLIVVQLIVCCVFVVAYYFALSKNAALSSLMGAMACLLPNWYFASKVFATSGASRARTILRSFYIGQAVKLMITVGLICTGFILFNDEPTPMLVTFITGVMVFRLVPLFDHHQLKSI